ncbi:ClpP/crotonase-like domain-containing protein [Phycomyces nitens]|nr:ClpP/crotonase-like domain-containing protein [Phycomyces nitens]
MSITFPVALPSAEDHRMTLSREGPLFILHLHYADNRFSTVSCRAILTALQIVEDIFHSTDEPTDMALVTTGEGKIFSNGLDLNDLPYVSFMDTYLTVLKRMVSFCIPTVAALNGHAFAGGCMFSFAHDYRVMRSDRGYMCMNEVDMPSPLSDGMVSIIRCKTTPQTFRNIILQGHRFTGQEALERQMVDIICPGEQVLDQAKALALKWAPKAKAGICYKQLKDEMYSDTIKALSKPYHLLANKL